LSKEEIAAVVAEQLTPIVDKLQRAVQSSNDRLTASLRRELNERIEGLSQEMGTSTDALAEAMETEETAPKVQAARQRAQAARQQGQAARQNAPLDPYTYMSQELRKAGLKETDLPFSLDRLAKGSPEFFDDVLVEARDKKQTELQKQAPTSELASLKQELAEIQRLLREARGETAVPGGTGSAPEASKHETVADWEKDKSGFEKMKTEARKKGAQFV
jgi:uncharacterized FlaG/YvyC family protein